MYVSAITNYFSTKGRINRRQFLLVLTITIMLSIIIAVIIVDTSHLRDSAIITITSLLVNILLLPSQIKRLHDLNWNGWLTILGFIPGIAFFFRLILVVFSGTRGQNEYGFPPHYQKGDIKNISRDILRADNKITNSISDIKNSDVNTILPSLSENSKDVVIQGKNSLEMKEIEEFKKRILELEKKLETKDLSADVKNKDIDFSEKEDPNTKHKVEIAAKEDEDDSDTKIELENALDMKPSEKLIDLVEHGKKQGFLTLEEINESLTAGDYNSEDIDNLMDTLEDLGIKLVDKKYKAMATTEKESYNYDWLKNIDVPNSIRMYLSEADKIPPLLRDEEIALARNIREREKELIKLVLECPITMREICSWEELVDQEEMTTRELGTQTSPELIEMRKKLREVASFVSKREKDITALLKELRTPELSDIMLIKYTNKLEEKQKEVVDKILTLNLNQNKIKRLINRLKNLADKLTEYKNNINRFDEYFGPYDEVVKLYEQYEKEIIEENELINKTHAQSAEDLQRAIKNINGVKSRYDKLLQTLPVSEKEFLSLNDRIAFFESMILQDKLKLIRTNLRLVVSIAKKHHNSNLELSDLIQEGTLALMKAVEKYEYKSGFIFSNYAAEWIEQSISQAIVTQKELTSIPNVKDIVEEEDYSNIPKSVTNYFRKQEIEKVLATLSEREQKIIRLRFGIDSGYPRTLEEVGKMFNVTRERVRQIEAKAIRKLRHPSRTKMLKDYSEHHL